MILIDANLLIYAYVKELPAHKKAQKWLETVFRDEQVALSWLGISAFLRISTNRAIFEQALSIGQAIDIVNSWIELGLAEVLSATAGHWPLFSQMLQQGQASANLVPDAQLAALCLEHGCRLATTDRDFAKFPGLKFFNPLETQ
jgi:uncharacterized protein